MSEKVISIKLNSSSIDRAIKELEQYKRWLKEKEKQLLERLAEIGYWEANVRFSSAMYDGVNDVVVTMNSSGDEFTIEAQGEAVAFIEFGTGVYYNSGDSYPGKKPDGVVGIGEFGQGKGQRRAWFYYGDPGTNGEVQESGVVKTRGNPAEAPMYYATEEMRRSIQQIAREVFG